MQDERDIGSGPNIVVTIYYTTTAGYTAVVLHAVAEADERQSL